MTNKQIKLLNFCGFEVDDNHLLVIDKDNESLVKICYNSALKLFTLKINSILFKPGDYDSAEKFSVDFNRKLSLVYELNNYIGGDDSVCS